MKKCHMDDNLREEYIAYIQQSGRAKSTAYTTANKIFKLWENCGDDAFWSVVNADNDTLRVLLTDYVRKYYPNQMRDVPGFGTSIRCFREFLNARSNGELVFEGTPRKKTRSSSAPRVYQTSAVKQTALELTGEMLEEEHGIVLADPGYGTDYKLIESVLKRFPDNTDPELVALKIALIDMTNSTHIGLHRKKISLTELADFIVGIKDFDVRIKQGDPSLVPAIAKNTGKTNQFSFATKYCTYHAVDIYGNDDYVIFDRVVKNALPKYVPGLRVSTIERWRTEFNYAAYKRCIDNLLDANGIYIPFRHRKLDHFLWHTYRKEEEKESVSSDE